MNDTLIYLGSSTKSFRCTCGCNVFTKLIDDRYECNACLALWASRHPVPASGEANYNKKIDAKAKNGARIGVHLVAAPKEGSS